MTVPCDSLAPVAVRRTLAAVPDLGWILGDAMLVATELVTNALRHSMCNDQDCLVVSVDREVDHVRICVRDPGTSGGTARIVDENEWFEGVGLRIVEQLATHWGSNRAAAGYEVWAQLPLVESEPGEPQGSQATAAGATKPRVNSAAPRE